MESFIAIHNLQGEFSHDVRFSRRSVVALSLFLHLLLVYGTILAEVLPRGLLCGRVWIGIREELLDTQHNLLQRNCRPPVLLLVQDR